MGCYGDPDIMCDVAACGYDVGGGGQGDSCVWPNECASGLQCTEAAFVPGCMGARCCTEICDAVDDPAACEGVPGTSCIMFGEGVCPPAAYSVGVCGV